MREPSRCRPERSTAPRAGVVQGPASAEVRWLEHRFDAPRPRVDATFAHDPDPGRGAEPLGLAGQEPHEVPEQRLMTDREHAISRPEFRRKPGGELRGTG